MRISPTSNLTTVLSLCAALHPFRDRASWSALEHRDEWLEWMRLSGRAKSTMDGYRQVTTRFLALHPGVRFSEFTDDQILGFIEMANPASRQQIRGCMANWFSWGFRVKRLKVDVIRYVPKFKQPPQKRPEVFTDAEHAALCALPEPDGTLMDLLLNTGMRKGEARNLTVRRIDFEHGELNIVEGAKGGSYGVVPIEHELSVRLAEFITAEELGPDDYLWYCHPGGTSVRRHDRAIADGAFHSWWVRSIAASGVAYRNPHVTRHSFATAWRRLGLSLEDTSFLLRHADFKTTKRVYDHTRVYDVRKRQQAVKREAALMEVAA